MLTEIELKTRLQAVAQAEYAVPKDAWVVEEAMLAHIGCLDPELRDDLIYTCSYHWLLKRKAFTGEQLSQILDTVLDEQHLFYKMGEQGEDSVFTRTFSVLQLPLLLTAHRQQPFIADVPAVLERVLAYFEAEQDLRGYVEGKGWAHAVAHTADALDDLAQCQELGAGDLRRILAAIAAKLGSSQAFLLFEEDERLTTALLTVAQRNLVPEEELVAWMDTLAAAGQADKALPPVRYFNIKHLLRSLYLRLKQESAADALVAASLAAVNRVGRFNK